MGTVLLQTWLRARFHSSFHFYDMHAILLL